MPEAEKGDTVRVGFRYRDGEVLSPEREAVSDDEELPQVVLDLGDGEWLTLAEVRDRRFLDWDGDDEDTCQHEWELRSEHDLWVCAWCQAEVTSPPGQADPS